jgi:hypothetical protein
MLSNSVLIGLEDLESCECNQRTVSEATSINMEGFLKAVGNCVMVYSQPRPLGDPLFRCSCRLRLDISTNRYIYKAK